VWLLLLFVSCCLLSSFCRFFSQPFWCMSITVWRFSNYLRYETLRLLIFWLCYNTRHFASSKVLSASQYGTSAWFCRCLSVSFHLPCCSASFASLVGSFSAGVWYDKSLPINEGFVLLAFSSLLESEIERILERFGSRNSVIYNYLWSYYLIKILNVALSFRSNKQFEKGLTEEEGERWTWQERRETRSWRCQV
jgi:hypothetical protein